jgi:hypothetical protein
MTVVIIRECERLRDGIASRECVIERQIDERRLGSSKPEGSTIAQPA